MDVQGLGASAPPITASPARPVPAPPAPSVAVVTPVERRPLEPAALEPALLPLSVQRSQLQPPPPPVMTGEQMTRLLQAVVTGTGPARD